MSESLLEALDTKTQRGLTSTILLTLPMVLLTAFMYVGGGMPHGWRATVPMILTYVFVNVLFFQMLRTGRTDKYRAAFFITMAITFIISFMTNLIEMRGSLVLSAADMAKGETPFCHMVIPMTIIPAALTRTIIFPGRILGGFADVATMFTLWIGATLALGRGFCSWGCFYGGLDDGFSRLRKKPLIKKISERWTYLPYAVLVAIVLLSALTLSPTYCAWLCPYKAVTEFAAITSSTVVVQTILFYALFIGLVIVLPILTKKRTQCGLFCPFGAFQSFSNKINPFEIRINRDVCKDCQVCAQKCPTFSLDRNSIENGRTRLSCMKCGRCVDTCPKGAIAYHVKGTPLTFNSQRARLLFIYPAFLFLVVFGGGMIRDGIYRILLLISTGSMIR